MDETAAGEIASVAVQEVVDGAVVKIIPTFPAALEFRDIREHPCGAGVSVPLKVTVKRMPAPDVAVPVLRVITPAVFVPVIEAVAPVPAAAPTAMVGVEPETVI